METNNIEEKVTNFHNYIQSLLDKYFPEKNLFMSSSDKYWMTPELLTKFRRKRDYQ